MQSVCSTEISSGSPPVFYECTSIKIILYIHVHSHLLIVVRTVHMYWFQWLVMSTLIVATDVVTTEHVYFAHVDESAEKEFLWP